MIRRIKKLGSTSLTWRPARHRVPGASLGAAIVLLAVACGGTSASSTNAALDPTTRVKVVTTSAILADLARNVGGGRVEVRSLVPPGADVHVFQTTPEDSIAVSRAGVIISNGFGLDDFLDPVIQSAKKADVVQVVAAEGLEADPIEGEPGRSQGDPHLWQNPVYAIHYVERIRDGLVRADLGNASVYRDNADAYIQQLRELDQEISRTLSDVPPERRHLVTFHDAFGHFAVRYGWRVSALVPGDASEVTPGTIVAVMERIGGEGISAVFAEPQFSPKVMEQVARDTGVGIGVIYSDSLDDNVPTFLDMMRFNARSLVEHLR